MSVEKYMFLKETEKSTTNSGRSQTKKKSNEKRPRKETHMRVRRYHEYTPLNVSIIDLYKEVGQVERFPKSKALKTRASTNMSLFCEYHNSFEHRTEDCYDLPDVVA